MNGTVSETGSIAYVSYIIINACLDFKKTINRNKLNWQCGKRAGSYQEAAYGAWFSFGGRTPALLQNTLAVQSDLSLHLQPDQITQELPVSPTLIPSQFHLWLPSRTAPSQPQIAQMIA